MEPQMWEDRATKGNLQSSVLGWLYKLVISPCNIQVHTGLNCKVLFQALPCYCISKLSPT